jgi:hypothetical protein
MAGNTGKGWRKGQVRNRYQQKNQTTGLFDIFNSGADYLRTRSRRAAPRG